MRQLFATCAARSPGRSVELSSRDGGGTWSVRPVQSIPRDVILSMSDFAWPPVLWTSLLSAELDGVGTGDLRALFDQDGIRWWLAHGYKEPFAVIWIRDDDPRLLAASASVRVERADSVRFRPHRVRMHACARVTDCRLPDIG